LNKIITDIGNRQMTDMHWTVTGLQKKCIATALVSALLSLLILITFFVALPRKILHFECVLSLGLNALLN